MCLIYHYRVVTEYPTANVSYIVANFSFSFVVRFLFWPVTMDIPSFRLFCLEQGDGSPEDHFVFKYLDLPYHSHYPDFTST